MTYDEENELLEVRGMYEAYRDKNIQLRRDLDQKDHQLAAFKAENEALRASNEGMRQQQYELEDRVDALRAERDRWKLKAQLATEQVEEEAESDRFSKEAFDSKCAEVRKLRDALRECHGTEPSVNFRDGKRVEYCPLCDDGTWPCKVARLLASAPEPEGEEEHLKHPTGDYCVYCLSQWPCAEAEGGER